MNMKQSEAEESALKAEESFIQCLENNISTSSSPISPLIYTQKNSNYTTILNSRIHNLRFIKTTTPKPLLIVTPTHASHIQGVIQWAKQQGLEMRIRSGGHDYEGLSYVSNVPFLVLDMFNLRSIDVDIDKEFVWVQAGATLGEMCYEIAKKSKTHGSPIGICPSVGVGGNFSGGGYGTMMRKYGLSIDNIVDAELIDANSRLLNRETMGEDLFWAIRGGGGASFGVILSYKIKLVRVLQVVTVFQVSRTIEESNLDIVLQWQEICSSVDNDLFLRLSMDVIGTTKGEKKVKGTFIAMFLGGSKRLMSLMSDQFPELGLKKSDCHEMSWIESVLFWAKYPIGTTPVEVLLERKPTTLWHQTRKSDYVKEPIPREGFEFILKKMIELGTPSLVFTPYGGRMSEIAENETPFPHRKGTLYKIQYKTNWDEEGREKEIYFIDLTRKLYSFMTSYVSKSPRQAFFNYRDLDLGINKHDGISSYLEGMNYGIKYFKDNVDKLVKIKTMVDPNNFFKNEQSIPVLPT
ncbi:hypothetical protein BVRB_006390 [Beta vulgaris subsp. vulgaris]|uniref:FAD-binding PCMH-type domain-containing protein n=1 Tax=Beta vulgaris subsp. vulgaris TaxID=3555 RepID=A0A0J8B6S0_BETVV|nr:berberine bridge enzyme-like 8 [Beta vulgaris subsp. vulgaris]KMS95628.1 hypothetical protein BVRB_006390 [Beta vulgaris subsp. vulgaris]